MSQKLPYLLYATRLNPPHTPPDTGAMQPSQRCHGSATRSDTARDSSEINFESVV